MASNTNQNNQLMNQTQSGIIKIPNISDYHQEIINNELILTPIKKYISTEEFRRLNFGNSIIKECIIKNKNNNNEIITEKTKYRPILIDIWKTIPAQKILQNTSFNIKLTDEKGEKGYQWCPEILMSVQSKSATETLMEILTFVEFCRYSFDISIQLDNGNLVNYKC